MATMILAMKEEKGKEGKEGKERKEGKEGKEGKEEVIGGSPLELCGENYKYPGYSKAEVQSGYYLCLLEDLLDFAITGVWSKCVIVESQCLK